MVTGTADSDLERTDNYPKGEFPQRMSATAADILHINIALVFQGDGRGGVKVRMFSLTGQGSTRYTDV